MALLRCTPPWNAPYTGSSSGASSDSVPIVRTEAGRLVAGRRQRRMWSAEEEQALAFAAAKRVLAAHRCVGVVGNVPAAGWLRAACSAWVVMDGGARACRVWPFQPGLAVPARLFS